MKSALFSWVSICVLLLAFLSPVSGHGGHSSHSHSAESEQMYTCSMHPQVRSTNPQDRCPICGMALVAVTTGAQTDDEAVQIEFSGRALALLNIQTMPVIRGHAQHSIEVSGQLEFAEDLLHTISAWSGGRIERLMVNYSGEHVNAGEPLVELYSPELLVAQQELLQALRYAEAEGPRFIQDSSQLTLQAARRRLNLAGLTEQQITELIEQGQPSDRITIVAPASGVVLSRAARQGDYVMAGDTLLSLVDTSRFWAVLEVYERDSDSLSVSSEVEVYLPALGRTVEGQVISIAPQINPQTRTRQVRVSVENPDGLLAAGMFVSSRIKTEREDSLLIPDSAPLLTGQRAVVYVQNEPGQFAARTIELGRKVDGQYTVTGGLDAGELVVSRGAFRIDSELQLRGQPSMMAPRNDEAVKTTASLDDIDGLHDVFAAYHHLWYALQSDDLAGWKQSADIFYAAVSAVNWPDDAVELESALNRGAGHTHHVGELTLARDHFYHQSQALIELAQAGLHQGHLYLMYCPMARNNQGAHWLQENDELLNPYFGAQMLRCGSLRDTLHSASHEHHSGGATHD